MHPCRDQTVNGNERQPCRLACKLYIFARTCGVELLGVNCTEPTKLAVTNKTQKLCGRDTVQLFRADTASVFWPSSSTCLAQQMTKACSENLKRGVQCRVQQFILFMSALEIGT